MRSAILGTVLALGACSSHGEEREATRASAQQTKSAARFFMPSSSYGCVC